VTPIELIAEIRAGLTQSRAANPRYGQIFTDGVLAFWCRRRYFMRPRR